MILRATLALRLIPTLVRIASWFDKSVSVEFLDESKKPVGEMTDDSLVYYVRFVGLSNWKEVLSDEREAGTGN